MSEDRKKITLPNLMRAADLQLGDTIKIFDGAYGFAIVIDADSEMIRVFRPYATCADFSMGTSVIPFIGIEHVEYPRDSARMFLLMDRRTLR